SPGIGGHGSGFGDTVYSGEELVRRFGAHPLGFMLYNVAGGFASLLFAEPRQGVYSLLMAWRARAIHPVVVINILSSLLTTALVLMITATTALWAFRAVGVEYQLRYDAFKIRNDWIEVLRPDKRDGWPRDPAELAVTQRLRAEAIDRRDASPSFMPRWADRYWVE